MFGNIQDASPALNSGTHQTNAKPRLRPKGIFATTMTTVEGCSSTMNGRKPDSIPPLKRVCLSRDGGHSLESCPQLEERAHAEKFAFLRGKRSVL